MEEIGTGVAASVTSNAIIELVKWLKIAAQSEKDLQFLITDLTDIEGSLRDVSIQFENQQKTIPPILQNELESVNSTLEELKGFIKGVKRFPGLHNKTKLAAEISDWKTKVDGLSKQLKHGLAMAAVQIVESAPSRGDMLPQPLPESGFVGSDVGAADNGKQNVELPLPLQELFDDLSPDFDFVESGVKPADNTGQIGESAPSLDERRPKRLKESGFGGSGVEAADNTVPIVELAPSGGEVLLQPLPESGFVGSGVEAAYTQLITWLNEPNPQARVIGVYGMAGVGKTALLRRVYNSYQEKKEVSGIFDLVIWLTVSQKHEIKDLQASIAKTLDLDLKEFPDSANRMMKLSAALGNKRFLLILDDVWRLINLDELGVKFGGHKQSKVLISSRDRDVVETMAENLKYCKKIKPLLKNEGWELFRRRAFRSGSVPDNNLLAVATEVAFKCKGLPLAINVVAAALRRRKTADEWRRALDMMKNADYSFPTTHKTIDTELYQRLRWSYDDLPDHNFQMCFLYCAAFPEDAHIRVERLVEMWTAEGLVPQKGRTYYMDVGQEYIDALVDRCLLEYVFDGSQEWIKVHDVLRDMAIYIGQGEEKWLFLASQHLHNFPNDEDTTDLQRISLLHNDITNLPTEDLKCPTLVSLLLPRNPLQAIPERFFANFMCLKVLDLSQTSIEALPASVGELRQLQFLNLDWCDMLQDLPDSICNLSHLQLLNLQGCGSLNSIPDRIGELKKLKHLHVSNNFEGFKVIPHQIYQLTSLNKLILSGSTTPLSVEGLSNLSNLIELNVEVEREIKGVSMSTWSEMRILELLFSWSEDGNRDDAALDILPRNMQSMKKLQSLSLYGYLGVSLPSCICQFQNLKYLTLDDCIALKELPALEVGSDAASGGFRMLERLVLQTLVSLERIVWNEGTMLELQSLEIIDCQVLETFQTEELPNLRSLEISGCDELKEWFIRSGGFPMLETLDLNNLEKLESIARSSSVWNEKTMSKLQKLRIINCPLLRRLPVGMDTLPTLKEIVGKLDWWEGIIWEDENVKTKLSQLFIEEKDP